jgi:membrane protease YdiL (CAAX protease family)
VQLILIQFVMSLAWVGFIFFLIAKVHHQPVLRTLRLLPAPELTAGRLILGGALLALLALVGTSFFPAPTDTPLQKALSTTPAVVLFVIFGIVVAPILEEIVFRGFIFGVLADLSGSRVAVVVTTVSFGALHFFQIGGSWPAAIVIMMISYVFTEVRRRRDSTLSAAIMHTAYNAMIFALPVLGSLLGLSIS